MLDLRLNYPSVKQEAVIFKQYMDTLGEQARYAMLSPDPFTPGAAAHERLGQWLQMEAGDMERYMDVKTTCSGNSAVYCILAYLKAAYPAVGVEEFTYSNLKLAALDQGVRMESIACDEEGMIPQALAQHLQQGKSKLIYLQPTVHNPTCSVMSLKRREDTVAVIRSFEDVYVIEDDAYRFLHPSPPPAILQLMPERTIYICSFSKTFNPFVRMAYVLYPKGLLDGMDRIIRITSSGSSSLFNAFTQYLMQGSLTAVIEEKRRVGVALYEKIAPIFQGLTYHIVPGSYHFWLQLPDHLKAGAFTTDMRSKGIEVMSSEDFSAEGNQQFIRIAAGAVWDSPELLPALEVIAGTVKQSA
ncbi:PLP-dependent aminotransferase family protein [Chitinophaga agrisoli]|uniref:PLP-dependent aminotransferase family protein n=1 Tax=Chitinophaga agrisoli TaxID=2607653 RepID=A0A5B2VK92_9BACT|nr:PLP-dependent aminotransferase family protein [Chitinophaga agrisoli]KAA2239491.1 PLP-dependent aminotransferase family protein [Chitinophaga agrisoli]